MVKGLATLGKNKHDSSFPIQKVGLRWLYIIAFIWMATKDG